MNHWMQSDTNRPLADGIGSRLLYRTSFPWQWISTTLMVHNLQSEAARVLRCSWYDAHLYWGSDSVVEDTEDLSLAYLIGKQRLDGSIGASLAEDDRSWIPQLNKINQQRIRDADNNEAFIRIAKVDDGKQNRKK
jgi:hypothetical protein